MNIRFTNAKIITMRDKTVIDGEVTVNGNKFTYVGSQRENIDEKFDRVIDCKGNILMPSFKNAHTHSAMTFCRSMADNLPLNTWLFDKIFPAEAKLKPEHCYWFTKLAASEYIANGITAGFDMYFFPETVAQAAIDSGIRMQFCSGTNNFGGIDTMEQVYLNINGLNNELVGSLIGMHAEYTTDIELMERIKIMVDKYQSPFFSHIAETEDEVKGCYERHGKSPVKLFDDLGLFEYGGAGFHSVYLNDEDIEIYKKHNVYAVINSCSNLKLASGIANVQKLLDSGINIAIGTDGAGSNNSLDMFREVYLTTVLQNVVSKAPEKVEPYKSLFAATVGGAKAMCLKDVDYLEAGKKADMIMLDINDPAMQPVNNIIDNIVYSANPRMVKMTMCNGSILYEDGKFLSLDLPEIYDKCNSYMDEIRP